MNWLNPDPHRRLQWGGPPEWQAAIRRAGLIARFHPSYGGGIDPHEALDLLAVLLYWLGSHVEGPDAVDLDEVLAVIGESEAQAASRADVARFAERLDQLHSQITDWLRTAGHDPDTPIAYAAENPVAAAWRPLTTQPADTPADLSEWPAWMVHPRGSSPLGRALDTVYYWVREQRRPRADTLTDFGATAWNPAGPRLHIHIPVNDAIRDLAAVYAPVLHAWRHLLRPVDPEYLHLTLVWHGMPASEVTDDQRDQLAAAVEGALATVEPATLLVGRPVLTTSGVVLDVSPDAPVWLLTNGMMRAFTTAFGSQAHVYRASDWWPHIALAYTRTEGPVGGLAYDLTRFPDYRNQDIVGGHRPGPVELPVTGVLIVDQDTYAPDGLTWTREHAVVLAVAA